MVGSYTPFSFLWVENGGLWPIIGRTTGFFGVIFGLANVLDSPMRSPPKKFQAGRILPRTSPLSTQLSTHIHSTTLGSPTTTPPTPLRSVAAGHVKAPTPQCSTKRPCGVSRRLGFRSLGSGLFAFHLFLAFFFCRSCFESQQDAFS